MENAVDDRQRPESFGDEADVQGHDSHREREPGMEAVACSGRQQDRPPSLNVPAGWVGRVGLCVNVAKRATAMPSTNHKIRVAYSDLTIHAWAHRAGTRNVRYCIV